MTEDGSYDIHYLRGQNWTNIQKYFFLILCSIFLISYEDSYMPDLDLMISKPKWVKEAKCPKLHF